MTLADLVTFSDIGCKVEAWAVFEPGASTQDDTGAKVEAVRIHGVAAVVVIGPDGKRHSIGQCPWPDWMLANAH